MKFASGLHQFLTGRWMRLLVWWPCVLIGCLFIGGTLESRGFRLLGISNTKHRFPAAMKVPDGVMFTPVDNSGFGTAIQSNTFQTNSNKAGKSWPAQLGKAATAFPSTASYSTSAQPAQMFQQFVPSQPVMHLTEAGMSSPQLPFPSSPLVSNATGFVPNNPQVYQTTAYGQMTPNSTGFGNASTVGTIAGNNVALPPQTRDGIPYQNQSNALSQLAARILSTQSDDPIKLRESLSQMLALALQQFETKQSNERTELKKAKEALVRWEQAISERESLKKSLVDSHIAKLLNSPDKLNWSFSGAQLLNGQQNQHNYQDVLSQLWSSHANQNATSPLEPQSVLPLSENVNEIKSYQPTLGPELNSPTGSKLNINSIPTINPLSNALDKLPSPTLPSSNETPSLPKE